VHTKNSCWSVGMVYNPRGLSGVSTTGPKVDVVLKMVSEPTLVVSQACGGRGSGIWCMEHVGPEWSHGMAYENIGHIDMVKRGGS
jgi:hypothetical protein